jgi:hypothetical protein
MKRVIAFSLYGNVNKYIGGLLENCKLINTLYPNFWIYVYLGSEVEWNAYQDRFETITNLKIIHTGKKGHIVMLHRFTAIDNDDVEVAFSRDADSRINERDKYCINKFLESNKQFQIIRDHKQHGVRILGGMWGIKHRLLHFKIYDRLPMNAEHGTDQLFLHREIYPYIKESCLVFDDLSHFDDEHTEKIQEHGDHVGKPYMPVDLNHPFGVHGEWYEIK